MESRFGFRGAHNGLPNLQRIVQMETERERERKREKEKQKRRERKLMGGREGISGGNPHHRLNKDRDTDRDRKRRKVVNGDDDDDTDDVMSGENKRLWQSVGIAGAGHDHISSSRSSDRGCSPGTISLILIRLQLQLKLWLQLLLSPPFRTPFTSSASVSSVLYSFFFLLFLLFLLFLNLLRLRFFSFLLQLVLQLFSTVVFYVCIFYFM